MIRALALLVLVACAEPAPEPLPSSSDSVGSACDTSLPGCADGAGLCVIGTCVGFCAEDGGCPPDTTVVETTYEGESYCLCSPKERP